MQKNNELQLKECFEKYADMLYRLCLFRLHGDEMAATDLVQESFYRAGVELEKGKKIENLKSFIFRIATNLIIDGSRKIQVESLDQKVEEDEFIPSSILPSPEKQAHAQIELERMYGILDELPAPDRDIFLLRFVEDITPKEIADMLGLDTNALTVRLHRLKSKVADALNYSL
ncbi:sigma-70 family RNA polymerase sigma factor [Candidatus Gracilibacteria bacterium]|nr:sigma-70 family RNA polymerase sigma factor [Candidatus Gracilibacteria bacterium]